MSEPGEQASPAGGEADGRSYEDAVGRLDEIIGRLDSGNAELRETLELCSEAKGLIEYCAGELAAVDQGLKELRLEELAASLATGPSSGDTSPPGDATAVGGSPTPAVEEAGPPPGDDDVPF